MPRDWKGPYSRRLAIRASERGRRMANIRWERWRSNHPDGPEPEPHLVRFHRFEFGVRDKATGEMAWHDLVSIRHAAKALGLILKFCQ